MDYHGTPNDDQLDQDKLGISAGAAIYGDDGNDTISVSTAQAIGGRGNDTIIATGPWGSAAYWDSPAGVKVDLGKGIAEDGFGTTDKLVGVHAVQGSRFDDTLIGGAADEYFYGAGGNNVVTGGTGFDTVSYYFEKSSAANISYDAASDTFTVVKHFTNGDTGVDKLSGVEKVEFTGDGSDGVVVLRSQFVGDFRTSPVHARVPVPSGAALSQFQIGDFNGDGHADFVFVTQAGSGTALAPTFVFLGDGKGAFADGSASLFGQVPMHIIGGGRTIVADFNNDGRSDLFQLEFGDDAPPFPGGQNDLYLSNAATQKLVDASSTLPRRDDQNHGGSAGDVNGDGYIDVLVNTLDEGNLLLINDGTGHLVEKPWLLPRPVMELGGVDYHETNVFSGMVDVNGDGALDLILGTWDGNLVTAGSRIFLNDGHGDFTKSTPIMLPASGIDKELILEVEAIDLNGDAFPDLMLSVTNGGAHDVFYHADYIQLLVNDGTGHFRDETATRLPQSKDISEPGWLTSLTAVDFNHDGFPDILAESPGGGTVTSKVYLNKGDGTFALDWESALGERTQAADVDGDGMADLVSATADGQITVSLNKLANGGIYKANFGGDSLLGSGGADTFYARPGNDRFDGAGGLDTAVVQGTRASYAVTITADGFKLASLGATVALHDVERVQFGDAMLAFDIAGTAGQAYRIYQAAFARTPDAGGLGFWIGAMDKGLGLADVAAMFVGSQEFADRYGTQDNAGFLATVYHNVLHREPDDGGFAFWGKFMANGGSRAELLAQFSESPENQAQVIGAIDHGIAFLPTH
jgi:hypothetical protein